MQNNETIETLKLVIIIITIIMNSTMIELTMNHYIVVQLATLHKLIEVKRE